MILLLLLISAYTSWRYSKTNADPDWAMFNLAAFTGSWYGRDWCDCKTPIIHLWYYALAKIVGVDIARVKFANHFLIGSFGSIYYLITGDMAGALAYTVIVNSPFLWAFHGNVSQLPAAFFLLALAIKDPWIACSFAVLAVLTDPKFLPSFLPMVFIYNWYYPAFVWLGFGILLAGYLYQFQKHVFDWVIEGSIIIPWRMSKNRDGLYIWMPWWTPGALMYILPWVLLAVLGKSDLVYWIPALIHLAVLMSGQVIRGNHLIPFAAWIANAGLPIDYTIGLSLIDFVANGFLLGNIWERHYIGFAQQIESAKKAGEWLRDKPGILWVNGMHTEVYIYARKPVPYGLAEQIEIREVNHERREAMKVKWKRTVPDYVVETPSPAVQFTPNGYEGVAGGNFCTIYQKKVKNA